MKFTPYNESPECVESMPLDNFVKEGMLNFFMKKNPDATLEEITLAKNEIYDLISKLKDEFYKILLPFSAIAKLASEQFIIYDLPDIDYAERILAEDDIGKLVLTEKNLLEYFEHIIEAIESSSCISPYSKLFSQGILACKSGYYDLAILGFLTIVDGLLSDISNNPTVSIKKRVDDILFEEISLVEMIKLPEEEQEKKIKNYMMKFSVAKAAEVLQASVPFNGEEPNGINRHWLMHGRSRKVITELDCIKLINFIYGLLHITGEVILPEKQ